MKPPCQHCAKRTIKCHGHCPDYQAYTKQNEKVKEARRNDATVNTIQYDSIQAAVKRSK